MEPLAKIDELPDSKLIDAYKAGYVYTMIVKDGYGLHVGENGYDRVFDHDVLGIMASLMTIGDFKYFDEYSKTILKFVQYPDAGWKFSWPYALYLQKTGDRKLVEERFEQIKTNTHKISSDRDSDGIMKRTNAIDSNGHWTIDNWSALFGLCTYKYICDRIETSMRASGRRKNIQISSRALKRSLPKLRINIILIISRYRWMSRTNTVSAATLTMQTGAQCSCSVAGAGTAIFSALNREAA